MDSSRANVGQETYVGIFVLYRNTASVWDSWPSGCETCIGSTFLQCSKITPGSRRNENPCRIAVFRSQQFFCGNIGYENMQYVRAGHIGMPVLHLP